MKPIWDSSALSEVDKTITKVKYTGPEIKANHFVVAVSPSSISMLESIINKAVKHIGAFVLDVYDLEDPCQYANGDDTPLRHQKTLENPIYVINDICITLIKHTDSSANNEIVRQYFETIKPLPDLLILDSTHESLFRGKTEAPSIYTLSSTTTSDVDDTPRITPPNIVCGLSSGFLIYSQIAKVAACQILYVVEEDFGASAASFMLWAQKLTSLFSFDVAEVTARAVKLAAVKGSDMGLMYT